MNEAEVRKIVNEKISVVLERLDSALYDAQGLPTELAIDVLRAYVDRIYKEINNG